ncbi:MAG: AmmeMemoRadiSam system protein A [Dehalococcoidales bacterium]|nr:AmmeMemoRadiSam system protein A [Dehalococcoidales bacterium]
MQQDHESSTPGAPVAHPALSLARLAVETYLLEERIVSPPADLPAELAERAGVFVCLKMHGALRGCIGTIEPVFSTIAEEVIQNAIASATRDPRFPAVSQRELADLTYSVDILTLPERVESQADLDPKLYGVIVRNGARRGLLLPDLDGVESCRQQVAIARAKAGIMGSEPVELFRFMVCRYE